MHIVQFNHVRVPVSKYGGAERIVVWLSQGLVELGHEVTLLAPKGSRVAGVRVVEVSPEEVLSSGFDLHRHVSEPVDIMHYHCEIRRSEERRVGKECRSRRAQEQYTN